MNEAWSLRREFGKYASACRKITGYYLAERYPFMDGASLTVAEVAQSCEEVAGLTELIRQELQ